MTSLLILWGWVILFYSAISLWDVEALSTTSKRNTSAAKAKSSLSFTLQKCTTPSQVLRDVGSKLTSSTDPQGAISSLVLVRLSKQIMTLQNEYLHPMASHHNSDYNTMAGWNSHVKEDIMNAKISESPQEAIHHIVQTLVEATCTPPISSLSGQSLESMVEGTKALAILARMIPEIVTLQTCIPLVEFWKSIDGAVKLQTHQLSGLHWAYECLDHVYGDDNSKQTSTPQSTSLVLPKNMEQAYQDCHLPFRIRPGCLENVENLNVANLVAEVPFQVDAIIATSTQKVVPERRETAWVGDEGVGPFQYSGKSMPRHSWSPLVLAIRDALANEKPCLKGDSFTGPFYYDCCLLNHYPDGGSAMRYHKDPDQGQLWDFHTAVVSVGASRRLAFRTQPSSDPSRDSLPSTQNKKGQGKKKKPKIVDQPHNFVVMHGDVMEMVENCQDLFQHAVKPADNKLEQAARASLVFKRTLSPMRN